MIVGSLAEQEVEKGSHPGCNRLSLSLVGVHYHHHDHGEGHYR